MINKSFIYIYFGCIFYLLTSFVIAKPMRPDMQALCDQANSSIFSPLPASVKSPSLDPLFLAIETGGNYNSIKSIIGNRHPDKIFFQGMTPLVAAAGLGNWPAAQALIDSGANVNLPVPDGSLTPLKAALSWSKYSIACKLIENKAALPSFKEEKQSMLREAIISPPELHNDAAIFVDYLLTNGFHPNDSENSAQTPLMAAVSLSNIPLIKVFLKHGARMDIITKNGRTVWTVAYEKNNPQVIKLLNETDIPTTITMSESVLDAMIGELDPANYSGMSAMVGTNKVKASIKMQNVQLYSEEEYWLKKHFASGNIEAAKNVAREALLRKPK